MVDESARGQGVAEALNRAAIERARAAGAVSIDLTSRPSREAANRLYQRIGFEPRETNVYRYSIATGWERAWADAARYQVSMLGRFLPARGDGGGDAASAVVIQRRESAGSITSSNSKCDAAFSPLPCS